MGEAARLHPDLVRALNDTGLKWEAVRGAQHIKILIEGRLAGIHPLYKVKLSSMGAQRAVHNTVSQIRRLAAEIKAQK
jgi:hypothetical protein